MKKQPGPSPSPANERPPQSGQPVLVADSSNTVSPDNPERRPPLFDITEKRLTDAIIACRTEVLEKIATGVPLAGTLTTMLSHMEALAPEMVCSVLLLDAAGERLKHAAAPGLPEEFIRAIDGVAIGPRVGSCGTAAFRREPVIVEDIATDPLWTDYRTLALGWRTQSPWEWAGRPFARGSCVSAT